MFTTAVRVSLTLFLVAGLNVLIVEDEEEEEEEVALLGFFASGTFNGASCRLSDFNILSHSEVSLLNSSSERVILCEKVNCDSPFSRLNNFKDI